MMGFQVRHCDAAHVPVRAVPGLVLRLPGQHGGRLRGALGAHARSSNAGKYVEVETTIVSQIVFLTK